MQVSCMHVAQAASGAGCVTGWTGKDPVLINNRREEMPLRYQHYQ